MPAEQTVGRLPPVSEYLGLRPPGGAMSPAEAGTHFLQAFSMEPVSYLLA